MRGRENLVAVMPFGKGLILETLRYPNELRAADPNFVHIPDLKVDKEMIELRPSSSGARAGRSTRLSSRTRSPQH